MRLNLLRTEELDLRELDASGLDFSNSYLRAADLRGIDFSPARLEGASLNNAKISGAYFPPELRPDEITLSVTTVRACATESEAKFDTASRPTEAPYC